MFAVSPATAGDRNWWCVYNDLHRSQRVRASIDESVQIIFPCNPPSRPPPTASGTVERAAVTVDANVKIGTSGAKSA